MKEIIEKYWVAFLIPVVVLSSEGISIYFIKSEDASKWISAFLQSIGLVIVVLEFIQNHRSLAKSSLVEKIINIFEEKCTILLGAKRISGKSSLRATIIKTEGDAEAQVRHLREVFISLERECIEQFKRLDQEIDDSINRSKAEISRLKNQLIELRNDVYDVAVGSIQSKVFGVFLIGYGVYVGLA